MSANQQLKDFLDQNYQKETKYGVERYVFEMGATTIEDSIGCAQKVFDLKINPDSKDIAEKISYYQVLGLPTHIYIPTQLVAGLSEKTAGDLLIILSETKAISDRNTGINDAMNELTGEKHRWVQSVNDGMMHFYLTRPNTEAERLLGDQIDKLNQQVAGGEQLFTGVYSDRSGMVKVSIPMDKVDRLVASQKSNPEIIRTALSELETAVNVPAPAKPTDMGQSGATVKSLGSKEVLDTRDTKAPKSDGKN